jgi:hypothetical protein
MYCRVFQCWGARGVPPQTRKRSESRGRSGQASQPSREIELLLLGRIMSKGSGSQGRERSCQQVAPSQLTEPPGSSVQFPKFQQFQGCDGVLLITPHQPSRPIPGGLLVQHFGQGLDPRCTSGRSSLPETLHASSTAKQEESVSPHLFLLFTNKLPLLCSRASFCEDQNVEATLGQRPALTTGRSDALTGIPSSFHVAFAGSEYLFRLSFP